MIFDRKQRELLKQRIKVVLSYDDLIDLGRDMAFTGVLDEPLMIHSMLSFDEFFGDNTPTEVAKNVLEGNSYGGGRFSIDDAWFRLNEDDQYESLSKANAADLYLDAIQEITNAIIDAVENDNLQAIGETAAAVLEDNDIIGFFERGEDKEEKTNG